MGTKDPTERKVSKHLNLPLDVVVRLEDEENQSKAAEAALRDHFDLHDTDE